jgi:hypothetical protein
VTTTAANPLFGTTSHASEDSTAADGPHWFEFTGPVHASDNLDNASGSHPLGRGSIEIPVSSFLRPWLSTLRSGVQSDPGMSSQTNQSPADPPSIDRLRVPQRKPKSDHGTKQRPIGEGREVAAVLTAQPSGVLLESLDSTNLETKWQEEFVSKFDFMWSDIQVK